MLSSNDPTLVSRKCLPDSQYDSQYYASRRKINLPRILYSKVIDYFRLLSLMISVISYLPLPSFQSNEVKGVLIRNTLMNHIKLMATALNHFDRP